MNTPEFLLSQIHREMQNISLGNNPAELYEPISYTLGMGGKRIRPLLCLMSCELFDGDFKDALYPAIGIEIFHNFTLLHDDIMDNAPLRRSMPTVHQKWNSNVAILSGDAMLVKAYQMMMKVREPILLKVLETFSECALRVCEGQQLDMNYERNDGISIEQYIEMIGMKTAALLGASLSIGAIIAKASSVQVSQIELFGRNLGIAFQLYDDILDVYGESDKFGKQPGGDILADKKTFLLLKAIELSEKRNTKEIRAWIGKQNVDPKEKIAAVTEIYNDLGIKELATHTASGYLEKAFSSLRNLPVSSDSKEPLLKLTASLLGREN